MCMYQTQSPPNPKKKGVKPKKLNQVAASAAAARSSALIARS